MPKRHAEDATTTGVSHSVPLYIQALNTLRRITIELKQQVRH